MARNRDDDKRWASRVTAKIVSEVVSFKVTTLTGRQELGALAGALSEEATPLVLREGSKAALQALRAVDGFFDSLEDMLPEDGRMTGNEGNHGWPGGMSWNHH